jgi:aspartate/methionine/tyrosine aminotransferase
VIAQPLPDFRLEVYLGQWEFAARHHLTASDAESFSIRELLALAPPAEREAFESLRLTYGSNWGAPGLLEAIAATYEHVDPDHVLCFAGAEEAIFWGLQELLDPGDHAVVFVPCYQSVETIPLTLGADVSALQLRPEDGWVPDVDALERLLRPDTKLVAINFPNNPTGAIPDHETFRRILSLCDERGIRVFSDEVYRGVEVDPSVRLPQAADLSERAISMNVMSKAYGLPGLRVGWLASRDRAVLERLERRKHYTTICNSSPSEELAAIALRAGDRIRERNRAVIEANVPVFDAFFAAWPELFEWRPPQGGCVCFPLYRGAEGSNAFCRAALEQAGVVLLPAEIYRSELVEIPDDRFRIGVGRRDPEPALAAFDAFLRARERA